MVVYPFGNYQQIQKQNKVTYTIVDKPDSRIDNFCFRIGVDFHIIGHLEAIAGQLYYLKTEAGLIIIKSYSTFTMVL